jgi:hypothetical protein
MKPTVYPGANTSKTLSPLLKEAYPPLERSESKKKKKKRFSKIADIISPR